MQWRNYQDALASESDHWGPRRYKTLALNVLRHLPDVKGKCLDVGCGEGLIASAVSENRPELTTYATDISTIRLRRAASRIPNATFVGGDALSLPWKDESFNVVLCCEVLEHLPEYESALIEMFRVLEKDGFLLITVPDRQKILRDVCSKCGAHVYKDGHIHSFSPDDLRNALVSRGKIVTLTPVGRKWRQLRRRIVAALMPGRTYKGKFLLCVAKKS